MKDNRNILMHNLDELKQAIMKHPDLALKQGAIKLLTQNAPNANIKE